MRIKATSKPREVLLRLNRSDDRLLADIATDTNAAVSPFQLKTILVPIDFSAPSEKALDYALTFAKQFGAQIVVLHVVEPKTYPNSFIMPPEIIEGNIVRMDAREEKLSEFSRKRIGQGIKTATVVQLGKPYQEIVKLAKARRIDLIILATHGYTGVNRLLLGSTTERVIRHAPCPVLVVREKEREFVLDGEASKETMKLLKTYD